MRCPSVSLDFVASTNHDPCLSTDMVVDLSYNIPIFPLLCSVLYLVLIVTIYVYGMGTGRCKIHFWWTEDWVMCFNCYQVALMIVKAV